MTDDLQASATATGPSARPTPRRALRRAVRAALVALLTAYFAFGALLLATRYVLMPRIDEHRPWLERELGGALNVGVRIGRIEAGWQGFNPHLRLDDVRLLAPGGAERLVLPRVDAVVSWTSALRLSLRFASLQVLAPELEVRRQGPAHFEVAGFVIEPQPGGDRGGLLDWALSQHEIAVRHARIGYLDETDPEPVRYEFTDVELRLTHGLHRLRFALTARPPAELAAPIDLRGDFRLGWLQRPSDVMQWRGQLYADFGFADLGRIAALTRLSFGQVAIERAQGALRLWLDIDRGRLGQTRADLALVDVRATLAPDLAPLEVDTLSGRFTQREWGGIFLGGQELALTGFSLRGPRLDLPPTDLRYRWTRADESQPDGRAQKTEFEASALSLDALSALAEHSPLARSLRQLVARYALRGTLTGLRAEIEGPLEAPRRYALRTSFAGLAMQAQPADPPVAPGGWARPGLPGFANLSGELELTERGGRVGIDARDATLEFPGIFEQPRIGLTRLTTQARWRLDHGQFELQFDELAAANADVELVAGGTYRRAGGGPGSVDLGGRLLRAEAAAVPRYLPLVVGAGARAWLAHALAGGRASDGSFRVRGDLREFPFRDPRRGEFRVALRLRDGVLDYVPASLPYPDGSARAPWPRLERIDADLLFERERIEIRGRGASVFGTRLASLQARIPDLMARDPRLTLSGQAGGPAADLLRFIASSPLKERLPLLAGASATGDARLDLQLEIPLTHAGDVEVAGTAHLLGNDIVLRADLPPLARATGRVEFTRHGFRLAGIAAGFVGGSARIEGGTRPDGSIAIAAVGAATPAGARRAVEGALLQRLLARATGTTRYSGTLTLRDGRSALRIESDLSGWAIDAPAPFSKTTSELVPLRIEIAPQPGTGAERDTLRVTAGSLLNVRFERVRDARGELHIERGVIAIGEDAALPAAGVLAHINLPRLDADQWLPLLEGQPAPSSTPTRGDDADSAQPDFINLRVRELVIAGKPVANVVAGATRLRQSGENVWVANVVSDHASGSLTWHPAAGGGSGRISARLTRLAIPEGQRQQMAQLLDAPPADVPGFDVIAENFELAGRALGRLELVASNTTVGGTPAWIVRKLEIANAEARMSATGQWQREPGSTMRRMTLTLKLDFGNGGALLQRLGIPDALRGGQGHLEGDLSWRGSPFAIHYPTLAGRLRIDATRGQFLKAGAGGAGRLLGVLSLQSLPRRITLDFRDVFSEGFAFDAVSGSAEIKAGVLHTDDFRMRGVNASVLIEGTVGLGDETQNLHVLVLPEVNAGSASLVYALMANPAVGLGTFLAQLLLRDPLSKAFSFEYDITGSWSDPQVRRRERAAPEAPVPGGN